MCIMSELRGAECELHTSANKKGKYIQRGIALPVRVQSQICVLGEKPPWLGQDEEVQQKIGKAEIAAKMEGLVMSWWKIAFCSGFESKGGEENG